MTATDNEILDRARAIQAETGGSLTDAMLRAEAELTPKGEVRTEFEVTIKVKPRVGRWIMEVFTETPTHTPEERLAAYLETVLNRARITAIRNAEDAPEIVEGRAVTLRRADFERAT